MDSEKFQKDLLEYIESMSLSSCNSIKTFDISRSTIYTTIPHLKLKDKLKELVHLCFKTKMDKRRYKYLILGVVSDEKRNIAKIGAKYQPFNQTI